ncbi:MAG TPA: TetR family transcriptional regulator [Solirubrobacteraceae bacterium]|nr:TetR family transcriptional regulator [Solirubrobacteraceae bacterium]
MAITSASGARPRGAARREALLDAVLRIVAEVGADAVTHRRVAEEAGLPLASTTYYFDSKEHLLTAALERAAERDIARLHAFLAEADDELTDPLALAIDAILDPVQETALSCRTSLVATYSLMLEAARRPALRAVNRRWTDAYLDAVSRLLERAGSADPRGDAAILLAVTDGLLVEQLASDRTAAARPQLERVAAALVKR